MTKKDIENEPMLEETSDEILLEETSGTEAMLEETSDTEVMLEETSGTEAILEETTDNEVLLEEDSSESVLLEEDSEILLEQTTVQIDEGKKSTPKEVPQDFAEIHERWDNKLSNEFVDNVLNNISPYCCIEVIEDKIFRPWDNWLKSDDDDLNLVDKHKFGFENIRRFKRQKIDELIKARNEKDRSQEAKDRWKSILNDLHDIDEAIRNGAKSIDDLKKAVKHNISLSQELGQKDVIELVGIDSTFRRELIDLLRQILYDRLTPKEVIMLSDKIISDIQQPLINHFKKVKTEKKRKQQAKTALINVERDAKTKSEAIVEADTIRKQRVKIVPKNTETDARVKRKVEARKPKEELKKAETEARMDEVARRQEEAEEDAKEEKKKRRRWGCISIIAFFIIYSLIPSSIKSCQEENESENNIEEVADVTYNNDEGDIENLDISSVEEMLEKKFDYVNKYDNYFEIRKKSKYGIADLKGNIKIKPQYDYISSPNEELGAVEVRKEGKYGMVSLKTLTEIIETKYDYIGSVSEESKTFEVRANGKYGLYSANDLSEIVAPTYDYIGSYNEDTGLIEVRKNSKYGLFSPQKRKEVAPCEYNFITYDSGLYRVRKDGKSGYLNSDGSVIKIQ